MLDDGGPSGGSSQDPDPLWKRLQSLWAAKNVEKLEEEIQVGLAALEDPLEWLLDRLEDSREWKGKGHSLATHVVRGLQTWLKKHPGGQQSGLKLKKLQARVFPILAQCHGNLLGPLIVIYQLHAADRHYLLGQISHLFHKNKYKEAAVLSIKLNLQPDLTLEEMCVPLLLQDKTDLVEAYVEGYPDLQEQLLRMLDSWFAPGVQIKNVIRSYPGLSNIKTEKLNHRTLTKMAFRFLDKYHLDPALCPNVINQRHLGTLKYLVRKRFVEKTMTQEIWMDHVQGQQQRHRPKDRLQDTATARKVAFLKADPHPPILPAFVQPSSVNPAFPLEMLRALHASRDFLRCWERLIVTEGASLCLLQSAKSLALLSDWSPRGKHGRRFQRVSPNSTVRENRWLQEKLIQLLVRCGGLEVAAWWALHYGLPRGSLPDGVMEEMEKLKLQERKDCPEEVANMAEGRKKDGYYRLPIPRDQVLLLSTWEEVQKAKESVLQPGRIVGIDMEWRSSFGFVGEKPRVSLVQLAIQGRVFLLDMLQLLRQDHQGEEEERLACFFQALFADPAITKLGYGMLGDLCSLRGTRVAFQEVGKQMCAFLDLLAVQRQFPKGFKEAKKGFQEVDSFPAEGGKQVRGLSLLVRDLLGKPLDKTEQLSNWDRRPLREDQILYAASDAYCLLEIYATLLKDPAAFGLSPDLMTPLVGKTCPGAKAKKSARQEKVRSPHTEISEPAPEGPPAASSSVPIQDFRVVCDNMLQGLGRYLRCLGADVQILENEDEHRKAAEIARQEGRVILTSGLPYQTLHWQVGEGHCFQVDCSEKAKDQALQVLKHFGVQVNLADVFSRCQACNCNQYLKIPKEEMVQMMKESVPLKAEDAPSGEPSPSGSHRSAEGATLAGRPSLAKESALLLLPSGNPLRIEAVPPGVLLKEDLDYFYGCSRCGKVFWEGSHFGRLVSQFQEVLDLSEGSRSLYNPA
nr:exonuclease mut-7 homolog [Pogona vitticeps]